MKTRIPRWWAAGVAVGTLALVPMAWNRGPEEIASPPTALDAVTDEPDAHPHDRAVADFTEPQEVSEAVLFEEIGGLAKGQLVDLPVAGGGSTKARVNYVHTYPNGATAAGGRLADGGGIFEIAREPWGYRGFVLRRGKGIAHVYGTGPEGGLTVARRPSGEVVCEPDPDWKPVAGNDGPDPQKAAIYNGGRSVGIIYEPIPILSSLPRAAATIYLDFDGEVIEGHAWEGGERIVAPAYNLTAGEVTAIWQQVAEDYAPFEVNVTTDLQAYLRAPQGLRIRCITTSNNFAGAGGVAFTNTFRESGEPVCWNFYRDGAAAVVISHEVGHTFGLHHDGKGSDGYYGGHGNWGPIMGAPYGKAVTHWCKGDYPDANQQQDDLLYIGASAARRADDHHGTSGTATPLVIAAGGAFSQTGVIASPDDVDRFIFQTNGGTLGLQVNPAPGGPNLDVGLKLHDSGGNQVASASPSGQFSAGITTVLAAGTYTLSVDGTGDGTWATNGYDDYGSLGAYTITGTVASPGWMFQVPANALAGAVAGTVAPGTGTGYAITQGNVRGAFAIHPSAGILTVANPGALVGGAQFDLVVSYISGGLPVNTPATVRIARTRGLKLEVWTGLGGSGVGGLTSSPNYPNNPDFVTFAPIFQGVVPADNYGQKFSGYLVPDETGMHRFATTSDDASQLWLSTNDNPANKVLVAANNPNTEPDDYNAQPGQRSADIPLVAGQRYYIELLHRENYGRDHVNVAWQTPTRPQQLIASDFLEYPGTPPNRAPWLANRTFRVREDRASGTVVGTLDAGDFEAGSVLSGFTITGGNAGNAFALDASTGTLTVNGPLSFTALPKYLLDVRVTDSGGLTTTAQVAVEIESLAVKREFWAGIGGESVADLTSSPAFPENPDDISYQPFFEAPVDAADTYGQRLSGYLRAPDTGSYTFWLASDDNGEFWLSTDEDPSNKVRIAHHQGHTNPREWGKYASQKSAPVTLEAGRFYYIEALQKDGYGGDHLSVAWQGPDFGQVILGAPHVTQQFYNHGAPVLADASVTVYNRPLGSPFLTLEAKDWADPGTVVSYGISAGNEDGAFVIDPLTGGLSFSSDAPGAGTRVLTISATDNGHPSLTGTATVTVQVLRAAMKREVWHDIPGTVSLADLRDSLFFPGSPDESGAVAEFRAPSNVADSYGQRLSGFLVPPVSGDYTFWIASDDSGEFWLSTDMNPANKSKRCEVIGHVAELQWNAQANQQSAVIPLVGGQRYYVEALQRDGINGDHLAVAWQGPGFARTVIGGNHLLYPDSFRPALKREVWTDVAGYHVASLTADPGFPHSPDETTDLETFEAPKNTGDNYGQKISGYVVAPETGDYRFWIASDDGGELWFAADGQPAGASRIAWTDVATGERSWDQFPSQRSALIPLVAGQRCYIEALMKEAFGDDFLAVAWEGPGFSRRIIGNGVLEHPDAAADRSLLQREQWLGISGNAVADLTSAPTFPAAPSSVGTLVSGVGFAAETDVAENFGQRVSGYLVAPETGRYTFWIASDDAGELWVSTDESPANRVLRAQVSGYTNPNEWDAFAEQRSVPLPLVAGRRYYIEALHKEGAYGDHLSVAWDGPGFDRQVIQNPYLEHPLSIPGTPSIRREVWTGIGGTQVPDLTSAAAFQAGTPDSRGQLTAFESPRDQGDNHGQRISAMLVAPETGNFRFWIASDDASELWISPDEDPAHRVRIAATDTTGFREWTANATQVSGSLPLVAGRSYYLEALQKEGGGQDFVSVAWEGPSFARRLLDGRFLTYPGTPPADAALKREVWTEIGGNEVAALVSDPGFPASPDETTTLRSFEAPVNAGDNYGQKISGYLIAPAAGDYRFWVASDDDSELWLATDGVPANRIRIAWADEATGFENWEKLASQQSALVSLTNGQRCYIEARMKEGGGDDYLSVAWEGPGFTRRVIGMEFLEYPGLLPGEIQPGTPAAANPLDPGYLLWLDAEGLEGADRLASADPNHNGIPNALEFVLGGDPDGASGVTLLPQATYAGEWAFFEFRRSDVSAASAPFVQYGDSLGTWTTAVDGVGNVQVTTEDDGFGPGVDRVTVRIPRASEKLFMRLAAGVD